jgi:hypothetical protein
LGDIAIDDISYSDGLCQAPTTPSIATSTNTPTSTNQFTTTSERSTTSSTQQSTSTTTTDAQDTTENSQTTTNSQESTTADIECPGDYCKNGGVCSIKDNRFKCKCDDKFTGDTCETLKKPKKKSSGKHEVR